MRLRKGRTSQRRPRALQIEVLESRTLLNGTPTLQETLLGDPLMKTSNSPQPPRLDSAEKQETPKPSAASLETPPSNTTKVAGESPTSNTEAIRPNEKNSAPD